MSSALSMIAAEWDFRPPGSPLPDNAYMVDGNPENIILMAAMRTNRNQSDIEPLIEPAVWDSNRPGIDDDPIADDDDFMMSNED